jgi:nucleoside-diphosphate-sugar epimerase
VWHLPTDKNVLTMKQIADLSATAFGMKPGYMVLPRWMLRILGLFISPVKESMEMLYQNDSDYLFDSSKFNKAFAFKTTTYAEGIQLTSESYKSK